MAVKYHCRKCGKRFVDWGAEKLGYKCPECEGEELVRVGSPDDKAVKRPSLKRKPRRVAIPVPVEEEDLGVDEVEVEPLEVADVYAEDEEELEEEPEVIDEVGVGVVEEEVEDVVEDEGFVAITPAADEGVEEVLPADDEWTA